MNNIYNKIYLDMCSNNKYIKKQIKQTICNIKSKKLLLEQKKQSVKARYKKLIILEQSISPSTKIDYQSHVAFRIVQIDQDNKLPDNDVPQLVSEFFGHDIKYKEQQISNIEVYSNIFIKQFTETWQKAKATPSLKDNLDRRCVLALVVMQVPISEDKSKFINKYLIMHTNKLSEQVCKITHVISIVPEDPKNWMEQMSRNLQLFQGKNQKDLPLEIATVAGQGTIGLFSSGWNLISGGYEYLADQVKKYGTNGALPKYIREQYNKTHKTNYTKSIKNIVVSFIHFKKQKEFKELTKEDQTEILIVIGESKQQSKQGLINFKQAIDNKEELNQEQYKTLRKFAEGLASKSAAYQAKVKVLKDQGILDSIPQKQGKKSAEQLKKNEQFQKMSKQLGFKKNTKQYFGFAGLFSKLLDKILDMFGCNGKDEEQVTSQSEIKKAMPFVAQNVGKTIQPGEYPIFFGGAGAVSPDVIKSKFEQFYKK